MDLSKRDEKDRIRNTKILHLYQNRDQFKKVKLLLHKKVKTSDKKIIKPWNSAAVRFELATKLENLVQFTQTMLYSSKKGSCWFIIYDNF